MKLSAVRQIFEALRIYYLDETRRCPWYAMCRANKYVETTVASTTGTSVQSVYTRWANSCALPLTYYDIRTREVHDNKQPHTQYRYHCDVATIVLHRARSCCRYR